MYSRKPVYRTIGLSNHSSLNILFCSYVIDSEQSDPLSLSHPIASLFLSLPFCGLAFFLWQCNRVKRGRRKELDVAFGVKATESIISEHRIRGGESERWIFNFLSHLLFHSILRLHLCSIYEAAVKSFWRFQLILNWVANFLSTMQQF